MTNSAIISDCGKFRFRLDRNVDCGELVVAFFGINPSTADATIDDPTVRKWKGFSERMNAKRFIVGNIFAYRTKDVKHLVNCENHREFTNLAHISEIISEADLIVPCWGNRNKVPVIMQHHIDTFANFLIGAGKPMKCWGFVKSGDPKHPLMLGYNTDLEDFKLRRK